MRVFVTGAAGFIGSRVVDELLAGGHQVLGLARSDQNEVDLKAKGVAVHRGDVRDHDSLVAGVRACDGVAHLGFIHEFDKFVENIAIDRAAVEAMLGAMEGTDRPFVLSSGVAMVSGRVVTEDDPADTEGFSSMRGATETLTVKAAERGIRTSVIRLPQVHDVGDKHGFVSILVEACRGLGAAVYMDKGENHWAAGHRSDVARLYRLAIEKAPPGQRLHAVGEEGVRQYDIAKVISEGLDVPMKSLTVEEAVAQMGFLVAFAAMDNVASSAITQRLMGWTPTGRTLIEDLRTHSALQRG